MSAVFTIKREVPDYGIYKLKGNPFPASPVPEESPRIFANQERAKKQIMEVISRAVYSEDRKPAHTIVLGGYGNGKSHALKVIRTSILDQLYPDNLAVAGYVPATGWSLQNLCQGFMRDLGTEFFEELKIKILQLMSQTEGLAESSNILINNLFLDQIRIEDRLRIRKELQKFLYSTMTHLDLVMAFLNMFSSEDSFRIAYRWICGEWIDLFTLRRYNITSRLDSDEKALAVFVNFRKLLEAIGFKMMFVCVDEFEKIMFYSKEVRTKFLDAVRHLMDWNPTGLTLIISCSPEAMEGISDYPPLDRISLVIPLEEPTLDTIGVYVDAYLAAYKSERTEDPLFPFDRAVIRRMFALLSERGKLNIRNFLKLCYYAVEEGLSMEKDRIDEEVIDRLKERREIYLG